MDDDIIEKAQHSSLSLQDVPHSLLKMFMRTGNSQRRHFVETKMAEWSDDCGERVRFFIQEDFATSDVGVQFAENTDTC